MKKLSTALAIFTASMFSLFFLSASAFAGEGPMKLPENAKALLRHQKTRKRASLRWHSCPQIYLKQTQKTGISIILSF